MNLMELGQVNSSENILEQMTFGTKFRPCLWDCLCQLREWWINPRKKKGLGEGGYFTHMCACLERPEKHICGY